MPERPFGRIIQVFPDGEQYRSVERLVRFFTFRESRGNTKPFYQQRKNLDMTAVVSETFLFARESREFLPAGQPRVRFPAFLTPVLRRPARMSKKQSPIFVARRPGESYQLLEASHIPVS